MPDTTPPAPRRARAFLWDLDGVLADTEALLLEADRPCAVPCLGRLET